MDEIATKAAAPDDAGGTGRRASIGAQRNPASAEAILKAAEEILLESGGAGFSIEAVARRAKAGKPTIYRWWPSRAALLLDVYHRRKEISPWPDTGGLEGDLTAFLNNLLGYWRKDGPGAVFRSVIAEAQSDPAAARALGAYAAERRVQTGEIIRRARARGEVADWVVPELVAETLASFAWGRLLTDRLDASEEEIGAFVRQILSGIRA